MPLRGARATRPQVGGTQRDRGLARRVAYVACDPASLARDLRTRAPPRASDRERAARARPKQRAARPCSTASTARAEREPNRTERVAAGVGDVPFRRRGRGPRGGVSEVRQVQTLHREVGHAAWVVLASTLAARRTRPRSVVTAVDVQWSCSLRVGREGPPPPWPRERAASATASRFALSSYRSTSPSQSSTSLPLHGHCWSVQVAVDDPTHTGARSTRVRSVSSRATRVVPHRQHAASSTSWSSRDRLLYRSMAPRSRRKPGARPCCHTEVTDGRTIVDRPWTRQHRWSALTC